MAKKPKAPAERVIWSNWDNEEDADISLEDERGNLDIRLDGVVVAFVDMGLWYGRPKGAKVMGCNVNSIFGVLQDYNKFYADRWNVRSDLAHHDGTHHCLYRIAPNSEIAEHLVNMIAYGGMTEEEFKKRTKSLRPYVAEVYGW